MRCLSVIIGFILSSMLVSAQDSASVANDVTILYRYEASGGITLHSNGLGVLFRKGKHLTGYKKRMFEAEFVSMRHPKQYKVTNPVAQDQGAKPFFYGKINYVYIPRVGFGIQHILFGKAEQSGVEVRYNYYGGLDLAITKPVYMQVLEDDPTMNDDMYKIIVEERYNPNDPHQSTVSDIYGPASFFRGFDKLRFHPGAYGKFSLSFEYGGWRDKITSLETGVVVDYFPSVIPIMANTKNNNYYFNFYISLFWGAKW